MQCKKVKACIVIVSILKTIPGKNNQIIFNKTYYVKDEKVKMKNS